MVHTTNNKHALSNKLPTTLQPLHCVGSARPSTALTGLGSDATSNLAITHNTWKPPDISSLHNVIRTGIRLDKPMQTLFSLSGYDVRSTKQGQRPTPIIRRPVRSAAIEDRDSVRTEHGGAERDRTADPLLAKQVLSQLSYSPSSLRSRANGAPRGRRISADGRLALRKSCRLSSNATNKHGGPG